MDILILFPAAVLAGAINSVAGGGTLFVFPALIFSGVPPIAANATSSIAVWPGTLASVVAYREELRLQRARIPQLVATSLLGGGAGAWILLRTPSETFESLIPWLLLTSTLLFTFSGWITRQLQNTSGGMLHHAHWRYTGLITAQFIIALYGGYFGAGVGILMLALLGLMGMTHIHEMNALKTLLGSCINGVAVVIFIMDDVILWPQAIMLMGGAVLGGYVGARIARRLPRQLVRYFVVGYGLFMSGYFFWASAS